MAQTTTAVNGCDAVVQLDGTGGTLVDISGSTNSVEIEFDQDIGEFKTFASKWKGRIACGKDAKIKLKAVYTTAAAEAMRILLDWFFNAGGHKTVQIDIPSSATGGDRFSGEVVLESLPIASPADDANPIFVEASLLPDGAIAWTQL